MLNYIRADLRRILRRGPRIVVLVLLYIIMNGVLLYSAVSGEQNSIGFMANVAGLFSVASVFFGVLEIMAVFADDFRAKTMQVAIGLGVTRPHVVLAKAIEYAVLALADTFVLAVLVMLGSSAIGITLNSDDVYQLVIRVIFVAINMLIPALFTMIPIFYLQGTGLAALLYLVFYVDLPAQIIGFFFNTNEIVINLRLNEIPFSAVLGAAATRLILHTGFPFAQILGLVAYMAAGYILTVLVFRKRELEF